MRDTSQLCFVWPISVVHLRDGFGLVPQLPAKPRANPLIPSCTPVLQFSSSTVLLLTPTP